MFGTSVLVVLGATLLAASSDDKTPSIEEVMHKLHQGKNAPIAKLKTALKSASPDWTAIQKLTKNYATLAAAMPKNDAPKGDQAAYHKLATAFASNAKALDAAAQEENQASAKAAFTKIGASCKTCHNAHRPED
jgi:cytochrome c556